MASQPRLPLPEGWVVTDWEPTLDRVAARWPSLRAHLDLVRECEHSRWPCGTSLSKASWVQGPSTPSSCPSLLLRRHNPVRAACSPGSPHAHTRSEEQMPTLGPPLKQAPLMGLPCSPLHRHQAPVVLSQKHASALPSARPLPSDLTPSVLVGSHDFDGFLRPGPCGFVSHRNRPWGSPRFRPELTGRCYRHPAQAETSTGHPRDQQSPERACSPRQGCNTSSCSTVLPDGALPSRAFPSCAARHRHPILRRITVTSADALSPLHPTLLPGT